MFDLPSMSRVYHPDRAAMTDVSTAQSSTAPRQAQPARGSLALASYTLWRREMVRFFRQRNRVVSALATPIVFWLLLGFGLHGSFQVPSADGGGSMNYMQYYFPGTIVMIVLFTAIFSTISVIEDRREGFLQGVLVAPTSRLAIVMGKILGGATIATIQGLVFVVFWPLISPIAHSVGAWAAVLVVTTVLMFVLGVGLTALGLCIAWPMDSTAGFHAVMNLFLLPMWFLSGALFPMAGAPLAMQIIMWLNPLTYGQLALSRAMLGAPDGAWSVLWPTLVFSVFAMALIGFAAWLCSRANKR
jgi:ABC-2 type transport system permease protein